MKKILAAIVCCLALQAPVRAGDLTLSGNTKALGGLPSIHNQTADRKIHLDLGSRPEEVDGFLDGPGVNAFEAPTGPTAPVSTAGSVSSSGWVNTGETQSLTLDARPKPHGLATLPTDLPAAATGGGVSDSTIYAGLGLLVLALGWACSGWVGRPRAVGPVDVPGERRSRRTSRVKMIPLNVDR